jgi:hypothetical protein
MQLHGLWRWSKQNVAAGMGWGATSTAMSVVLVVTALAILSVMVRDVGIGKVKWWPPRRRPRSRRSASSASAISR